MFKNHSNHCNEQHGMNDLSDLVIAAVVTLTMAGLIALKVVGTAELMFNGPL